MSRGQLEGRPWPFRVAQIEGVRKSVQEGQSLAAQFRERGEGAGHLRFTASTQSYLSDVWLRLGDAA